MSEAKESKLTKTAADVVALYDASWRYKENNHHRRWERNQHLYNNKRTSLRSYKGITNTFVPMVFSTVETATAALCSGRPSTDFVPQDMYQYIMSYYESGKKPDLKALNSLYDYYWDCDNWDLKTMKLVRNGFKLGTSCEWIYWENDKPRIIPMHPRDAVIDPDLSDPMQLITHPNNFYTGRRYMTTLDALKSQTVVNPDHNPEDPNSKQFIPRYKNLSKVVPGKGAEKTEKEEQEMWLGAVGDHSKLVEVIEIVTGKTIRSVANRTIDIEDRPNPLGIHYLNIHRFIADESIIHGKSIIDPIAHPQELLNDVTNQSVDAVTDQLMPNSELDPLYKEYIPMMKNRFGTVYPFTPGSWRPVDKPPVSPQAFNERQNMKNEIREATGVDQIVQGVAADGQTTATEINAQLNQAGQRFTLFARMLEKEGLYGRAKIVYKMILHYVKDKQLVPTNSIDGPKFFAFDPAQFDDTYEPKVQLETNVKSGKNATKEQATEAYTALIADPTNDLWEAKKILYPKMFDLTEEELDRIIGGQKPEQPMGMGTDPMAGGAPADPMGGAPVMPEGMPV